MTGIVLKFRGHLFSQNLDNIDRGIHGTGSRTMKGIYQASSYYGPVLGHSVKSVLANRV